MQWDPHLNFIESARTNHLQHSARIDELFDKGVMTLQPVSATLNALSTDPAFDPVNHPDHLIRTTELFSSKGTSVKYYLHFFMFGSTGAGENALKAYLYAFHDEIIFVMLRILECGLARDVIHCISKTTFGQERAG
jgi:hypothetical protein